MLDLSNFRVEFLPPNKRSKIQPLDARKISCVKAKYKRRLLLRIFDNIEANHKYIYYIDVITPIRWTYEKWNACPATVIKNCITHCFKKGSDYHDLSSVSFDETLDNIQRDAVENNSSFTRMGLHYLHYFYRLWMRIIYTKRSVLKVCRDVSVDTSPRVSVNAVDGDRADPEDDDIESVQKQLHSLAVAKKALDRHGKLSVEFRKYISDCQRELRLERQSNMKQPTIKDHFQPK